MKPVRYFFATSVLASVLSVSAFAGTIHTGAPEPDPTPAPTEGQTTTSDGGDMHTGDTDGATAGDAVAEGALSLVQVVLALL